MKKPAPDVRFITRKWPPAVGGMETYSLRLSQTLSEHVSLEVISLPGRPNGAAPSTNALLGFFLRTLNQLSRSEPAKIVHIGDMALWPLGWAATLSGKKSKLIISAHGRDVSLTTEKGWRAIAYRAYLRVGARLLQSAQIIANSRYIGELARRSGFKSIEIIPLGTDFGAPDSISRQHLIFAGRVTRSKGLRFLVEEVLPLLPADIRLRVAGPLWEESEGPVLADPRVDYLGALDERQLADEFSKARAVLIPSRTSEGFGLIALEAAACGAYVVASNHSGLSEVVSPSIGALAKANDPQDWARLIQLALGMSEEEYRTHSAQARGAIDERYRWARVAESTLAIYSSDYAAAVAS